MAQQLTYDLVLKIDSALKEIKTVSVQMQKELDNGSRTAGKSAGANFGSAFASIAGAIVGAMSFGALSSQIMGAFNASIGYSKSITKLEGAVDAYNKKQNNTRAILNDNTKSIEQKALALGYDTDQIYENTKATQSNEGAIKKLDAEITNAQRAFEDSSRVLENNITITEKSEKAIEKQIKIANREKDVIDEKVEALEKETEQRVKNIQIQRGFDTLDTEIKALEIQKNQFEIERDTAQLRGDKIAFEQAKENIEKLNLEISLRENKLDAIEFETDAIRRQGELQKQVLEEQKNGIEKQISLLNDQKDIVLENISTIREELSVKKNQFDIDIEPAKRKLEDLRATSVSIAGGQVLKQSVIDDINNQLNDVPENISLKPFLDLQERLYKSFGGTVSRSDLGKSIADLLASGVGDVGMVENLMKGFVDVAADGKSPFLSMGDAVSQLAEQFKTERGAMGETAGLTEEYANDIIPRGIAKMQEQGKWLGKNKESLTAKEKQLAKYIGFLDITSAREGIFNKQLENGNLAGDQLKGQLDELQLTIGQELAPTIITLLEVVTPMITNLMVWIKANPELTIGIIALVGGLVILATIIASVMSFMSFAGAVAAALGVGLVALSGIALVVVGAFMLLIGAGILIVKNWDWIKEQGMRIWNDLVNYYTGIGNVIAGVFSGNRDKVKEGFKQMFGGLGEILYNILEGLIKIAKTQINTIFDPIRDIRSKIQGKEFMGLKINLPDIPRFAKGGDFIVPPGYPNDSYLMRVQSGERVIVQTPAQQNISNNSGNTVNYNNYGNAMPRGGSLSFIKGFV